MKSLEWALMQCDWYPYKKGNSGHRDSPSPSPQESVSSGGQCMDHFWHPEGSGKQADFEVRKSQIQILALPLPCDFGHSVWIKERQGPFSEWL